MSGPDDETRGTAHLRAVLIEGLSWLGVHGAVSVFSDHRYNAAGAFTK